MTTERKIKQAANTMPSRITLQFKANSNLELDAFNNRITITSLTPIKFYEQNVFTENFADWIHVNNIPYNIIDKAYDRIMKEINNYQLAQAILENLED